MVNRKRCSKKKLICWSKKDKANKRYVACACKRSKREKTLARNTRTVRKAKSAKKRMLKQFKTKARR